MHFLGARSTLQNQQGNTMTDETILTNAQLILENEVMLGTLRIQDGFITDVTQGVVSTAGALDCGRDYVSPGLIELHTDNLERHMVPRPRVDWPHRAAIIAHDREMASAGITTVFDAIRVGSILSNLRKRYARYARQMADEVLAMRAAGALRISHHIHLRAEVCSETLLEELAEFGADDRVGILSLMDHTPGQRQFTDIQKFEDYVCSKNGLSREGFPEYIEFLYDLQARVGKVHEQAAVTAARRLGATLASHDDTTVAQVATSRAHGIKLAEFPTTIEAAAACHENGIATIMGAPNLVRGGSHSGNVAAQELAGTDRLDILSSDYVPASLLMGAVMLGDIWGNLPRGLASVTSTPADNVHLPDRGRIAIGQRADILRFGILQRTPVIRAVWASGERVG